MSNDQQVAMVSLEESQAKLAAMLEASPSKVDIAVDTHEEAHRELARRTNLDKNVILKTLLGLDTTEKMDTTVVQLFKRYFKNTIDQIYTASDLKRLAELLSKEEGKPDGDAPFLLDVTTLRPIVKKRSYGKNGQAHFCVQVTSGNQRQVLIGASRPDCAVWLLFTNDKSDVNNGVIYVRDKITSALKRVNTFEINPFVRGRGIVTNQETGETEVKDQLTFNPGWLAHTINNMDRYVFAPLVWVPPKPVRLPKHKRIKEVDVAGMIEKTLADSKIDPVKAADRVNAELEQGIDNYVATATEMMNKHQQDQAAIRGIGELDPAVAAQAGEVVQDSSFAQRAIDDFAGDTLNRPNETTLKTMAESREIIEKGTARFETADQLFAHLDGELAAVGAGPVIETLLETEVTDPELNPILAAMAGRND